MFGWLSPLGSFLRKALGIVSKVVTSEQLEYAIDLIKQAAAIFASADGTVDQHKAREWVIKILMNRFGIPERLARLILELAYHVVKEG